MDGAAIKKEILEVYHKKLSDFQALFPPLKKGG